MTSFNVINADCRDALRDMADNTIDAVVTDPPYELGFMSKSWDASGIAYDVDLWREVLRVLKPGGHLLAFGGSRTYHRLACAVEDAGFEIRDQIMWVYGSGFPKSLNVGKQDGCEDWSGWGTALKPAHEPIVVARKPLDGTVAANVLKHGVGALNIDGCRIGTNDNLNGGAYAQNGTARGDGWGMRRAGAGDYEQPEGRWPANFIHDGSDEVTELFPESKSIASMRGVGLTSSNVYGQGDKNFNTLRGHFDSGSAARFFYCAKAGKKERNAGLDDMPLRVAGGMQGRNDGSMGTITMNQNHHPTVKPVTLMRYLCRLITPPNGLILDPFTGSGTTGIAATQENFNFIGIEQDPEYTQIALARIQHHKDNQ